MTPQQYADWAKALPCTVTTTEKGYTFVASVPCRIAYANLAKPRESENNGVKKSEFSAVFLFPSNADLSPMVAAAMTVGRAKFPNFDAGVSAGNYLMPFKKQERLAAKYKGAGDLEYAQYDDNGVFINASSKPSERNKGGIACFDFRGAPMNPEGINPGDWVRASVTVYAYGKTPTDRMRKEGVGFGLSAVQLLAPAPKKFFMGASSPFGAAEIPPHIASAATPAGMTGASTGIPGLD